MEETQYFFCYARKDSEIALKLASDLRTAGINVWLDQLDIFGGERWDDAIAEALKNCRGMVTLLSPSFLISRTVKDELSYALEEGKKVIPVIVSSCEIPFRLRRVQYVDITADYDKGISKLLRALSHNEPSKPNTSGLQDMHESQPTKALPKAHLMEKRKSPSELDLDLPSKMNLYEWLAPSARWGQRYLEELLLVLTAPKQFIAKSIKTKNSLRNAIVFFLISLALAFMFEIPFFSKSGNLLSVFIKTVAFHPLVVVASTGLIYASFSLVGGKATPIRYLGVSLYVSGIGVLINGVFSASAKSIVRALFPDSYTGFIEMVNHLMVPHGISKPDGNSETLLLALIYMSGWTIVSSGWLLATWGAFRQLNQISRTRSLIALVIVQILASLFIYGLAMPAMVGLGLIIF